jgi:nitrate reductase NapAB chaperone NapD
MWPNPNYQFEFARPPFAWQKVRWPGVLLLLVCITLVFSAWQTDADISAQLQRLEQRKVQLAEAHAPTEQKIASQLISSPAEKKKPAPILNQYEQKQAEIIIHQLNIHWFDLLQVLEARQISEIALLQLLPDANRGQFVLSGEAKDYTTLLKYMGHLQEEPALTQVHLQKHQVNETHPQRPVGFEIQGGWQP